MHLAFPRLDLLGFGFLAQAGRDQVRSGGSGRTRDPWHVSGWLEAGRWIACLGGGRREVRELG